MAVVELTFVGAFELSLSRPFSLSFAATVSLETLGDVASGWDGGLGYVGVLGDVAGSYGVVLIFMLIIVLGLGLRVLRLGWRLVGNFRAKGRVGGAGRYVW